MKTEFDLNFPIEKLQEAEYNPRKIGDEAKEGLAASLESFGTLVPIVVNSRTGFRIVGGHQRVRVLREQGKTTVPATIVDLDDTDEMTLNLLLNSERSRGTFIPEAVQELLIELQEIPEFFNMRFDVLLAEYQIETIPDDFQAKDTATEKKRSDGMELKGDGEQQEDETQYLRLHYKMAEAQELENLLGEYMKENNVESMTEAVLEMLAAV